MSNEVIESELVELDVSQMKRELLNGDLSILPMLEKLASEFHESTEESKGRDRIRSYANKFTKTKTTIDKIVKEYKKELKKPYEAVSKNGKEVSDKIAEIRDKVRQPLTIWESEEKKRVADLDKKFEEFRHSYFSSSQDSSSSIQVKIEKLKLEDLSEEKWQEKYSAILVLAGQFEEELKEDLKWSVDRENREKEMAELQSKVKAQEIALQKERAKNEENENCTLVKNDDLLDLDDDIGALAENKIKTKSAISMVDEEFNNLIYIIAKNIQNETNIGINNSKEVAKAIVEGRINNVTLKSV